MDTSYLAINGQRWNTDFEENAQRPTLNAQRPTLNAEGGPSTLAAGDSGLYSNRRRDRAFAPYL
jgi:hypothetical protein